MEKEKMLVTQALNELKLLDNRICKEIDKSVLVNSAKLSEKNVRAGLSKEEFEKMAKSSFDSINALITRRQKIKEAVIASNAVTEIEICGEKMTVAQAIDMKNTIQYQGLLLNEMKDQYQQATANVNQRNASMQNQIDKMLEATYSKETKKTLNDSEYDAIAVPYKKNNEWGLVDPLKISDEITKLENFIDEFKSNVDSKLQISNCVTYIEF